MQHYSREQKKTWKTAIRSKNKWNWKWGQGLVFNFLHKVDWSKFIAVNGATAHPHTEPDGTTYNMGNSYTPKGRSGTCLPWPNSAGHSALCADRSILQHHPSAWRQTGGGGNPGGSLCAVLHTLLREDQALLLPQLWWVSVLLILNDSFLTKKNIFN